MTEEMTAGTGSYARVWLLDVPYSVDGEFDYFIPPELASLVLPGTLVAVPFGGGNRRMNGAVSEILRETEAETVKPILDVVSDGALLNGEMRRLCRFLKEQTLCTYGDAVRAVVPAAAISKMREFFLQADNPPAKAADKLPEKALYLYSYLGAHGRSAMSRLAAEFGPETPALLDTLVRSGLVIRQRENAAVTNLKYTTFVSLARSREETEAVLAGHLGKPLRSEAQAEILKALLANGRLSDGELFALSRENATRAQLTALEKKGLVTLEKVESYRNPYSASGVAKKENRLSDSQNQAYQTLCALSDSGKPCGALLHGVTGSGKTAVIRAMIDHVLASGRGVIVLVPEIALTPQTVGIFVGCYGKRVAVIHSSLSAGERFDAFRRIREGDADVVIGTRSAVFAPVKKLGLIVIDEEQEHTYKSETSPKYLTHDVARFRAAEHNALMLLASATPSLTSYYRAVTGRYTLVELTERYGGARLPQVEICDMREELRSGNPSPVSGLLRRKLEETASEGHQSIVFLNRRGYNSFITCRACGENVKCPQCSVSLTYHTRRAIDEPGADGSGEESYLKKREASGILACHYCGYRARVPKACPSCGSDHFAFMGYGTQRAEEELRQILPGKRVVRMDMDTTGGKFSHEEILNGFREGTTDVLIGTQMVTKGHDFPGVTLVGVLNADSSLYLDDYRAAERTFAMLTQVVGRAGRGDAPGVAVVQTMNPESDILTLAARQDYKTFYQREIRVRRALTFPPFCDMAVLTMSSADEALLSQSAVRLSTRLKELLRDEFKDVETVIFGPFEAPVYKVKNQCRMRMVVKCRLTKRSRALFARLLCEFGRAGVHRLSVSCDFNPSTL